MALMVRLSVLTLGNVVQRLLEFRRSRIMPTTLIETAKSVRDRDEFVSFRTALPAIPCPLAWIMLAYIEAGEPAGATPSDPPSARFPPLGVKEVQVIPLEAGRRWFRSVSVASSIIRNLFGCDMWSAP
jgi:hypothetical protein